MVIFILKQVENNAILFFFFLVALYHLWDLNSSTSDEPVPQGDQRTIKKFSRIQF